MQINKTAILGRFIMALGLALSSFSASALVAVEVAGIKSKDGGNTFYLKAGTTSAAMGTTSQISVRGVVNGVVQRISTVNRGTIVLEFAANEAGMVNDWQNFLGTTGASYAIAGVREGDRVYVNGDVLWYRYSPAAWTLATPAGQTFTVGARPDQNWHTRPVPCFTREQWPIVAPNAYSLGNCTMENGQRGYYDLLDPGAEPYPNPPSGTPAPVSFTLREYVPMTAAATVSETQGLNANITLANEDEGQTGAVFAALMIDGKFFFIHSDRSTITWYQNETTLPPVFTGTLRSGSFNLWPTMSQADRQALKLMGAVLLVGYGTGVNADAATLEMLKVDARLPTTTKQIDKMRYVIALPASGW